MFSYSDDGGQWKLRAGFKQCDHGDVCEGKSVHVDCYVNIRNLWFVVDSGSEWRNNQWFGHLLSDWYGLFDYQWSVVEEFCW